MANAGPDLVVEAWARVTLDASASSDPEGQALSFEWAQTEGPELDFEVSSSILRFDAPRDDSELAFAVTVSDGTSTSSDEVRARVVRLDGPRAAIDGHPFLPRLVTGDARGVAVRGHHAFVADATAGLVVFDLSAWPGETAPVATVPIETPEVQSIELQGDRAYVGARGLYVFDVSDPRSPSMLGGRSTPGARADRLAVSGTLAFLGDFGLPGGLVVMDVTNPADPTEASRPDVRDLYGLAARGSFAYVSGLRGVFGIDATDPEAPIVTEVSPYERGMALLPIPGTDYIVMSCPRTRLFDASDPGSLRMVAESFGCGTALALEGSRLYFSVGHELQDVGRVGVVDIDPSTPALTLSDSAFYSDRSTADIDVWGDYVLVAAGTAGVLLVDTTPELSPNVRHVVATAGSATEAVWAEDAVVATTSEPNALHIIDVESESILGSAALPSTPPQGLAIAGTRAYVAGSEGVRIVDMEDPSTPTERGFIDVIASSVAVAGMAAFVGTPGDINYVFDVTDATSPTETAQWSIARPEGVNALTMNGDLLLVGDRNAFAVFDASTPSMPDEVFSMGASNSAVSVAGWGARAAFADAGRDFHIIDLESSPPSAVGTYSPGQSYKDIAALDGFLYAAAPESGIHVLDVADPRAPVRAGLLETAGWQLESIDVGDLGVVAADEDRGVLTFDAVDALRLWPDRVLVGRGEELRYSIAWTDRYPTADEQVACFSTAGACIVEDLDQVAATATVLWTLPDEAADHDLAVAVGNPRYFLVRRDRVRVE